MIGTTNHTADLSAICRIAVIREIEAKGGTNHAYGNLYSALTANNYHNAVMDAVVKTTELYANSTARLSDMPPEDAVDFIVNKIVASKAAVLASENPGMISRMDQANIDWVASQVRIARGIEEEVSAYMRVSAPKQYEESVGPRHPTGPHNSHAHHNPGTTGSSGTAKTAIGRRQLRRAAPIDENGAEVTTTAWQQPVGTGEYHTPTEVATPAPTTQGNYDADGYYSRPLRKKPGSSVEPETRAVIAAPKRKMRTASINASKFNDSVLGANGITHTQQEINGSPVPYRTRRTEKKKIKENQMPEMKLTHEWKQQSMDYPDHQLYTIFGKQKSKDKPTDFMGALASVNITDAKEFSAQQALEETKPAKGITFIRYPHPLVASGVDDAITAMRAAELDGIDGSPIHSSCIFEVDVYEPIKQFHEKIDAELFVEESPLRELFSTELRECNLIGLKEIHTHLAELLSDTGETNLLASILNRRLTREINRLLEYDLFSEIRIEDFTEDFLELVGLLEERLGDDLIKLLEGTGEPTISAPGYHIPYVACNLIGSVGSKLNKELNARMKDSRKDTAARSIFLATRRVIVVVRGNFADLPITAIESHWCKFSAQKFPWLTNLVTSVMDDLGDESALVSNFHFIFQDGIDLEVGKTSMNLLDKTEGPTYIGRIVDKLRR